jgi:hypothetical protein
VVVTHSVEPGPLGRRHGIPSHGALDVGAMGCEVLLTGDADVAPRHLTFEWRGKVLFATPHAPNVLARAALDGVSAEVEGVRVVMTKTR